KWSGGRQAASIQGVIPGAGECGQERRHGLAFLRQREERAATNQNDVVVGGRRGCAVGVVANQNLPGVVDSEVVINHPNGLAQRRPWRLRAFLQQQGVVQQEAVVVSSRAGVGVDFD